VKSIDALEAQFKEELCKALRRAVQGRSPTIFSLNDNRSRSSARRLRVKAERIMELRQTYSVDSSAVPAAARYLAACVKWKHRSAADNHAVQAAARDLLQELEAHAA
jgi:hypothetical protein